ncbi:MAG: hypothetical protein ABIB79_02765 [archaeon]
MTEKTKQTLAERNIDSVGDFMEKIDSGQNYLLGLSGGIDSTALGCLLSQRFGKDRLDTFTIVGDWLDKEATQFAIDLGNKISRKNEVIPISSIYHPHLLKNARSTDYAYLLGQVITLINNQNITTHQTMISANVPETAVELGNFGTYQGEISPFAHFFKHEIYAIAPLLDVPQEAIERVPGTGIVDGMSDEELIGVPYENLERYLLNVRVKDNGSKAFSLEYLTQDREGVRLVAGITKKQLENLEYRILTAARFWIREGPRPIRKEMKVTTKELNPDFLLGPLFRPASYTIAPAGEEGNAKAQYQARYNNLNQIGVVPINDRYFECDEKVAENVRKDYSMRKDAVNKIVLLKEKDQVKIAEHTPEGLKVLTVKRGDIKVRYGC